MNRGALRADVLLLITAAIWGFAFAAQRAGMEHIGPFLYTGIRFLLGAAALLPVWILGVRKQRAPGPAGGARELGARGGDRAVVSPGEPPHMAGKVDVLKAGAIAGIFLFSGVTFQQIGLLYTTAGKAGFITGLYVIIVPVIGMFWKQRSPMGTWTGALLAVAGLYLLSVSGGFRIAAGDLLVLTGAFFWALHVHVIGRFAVRMDPVKLAVVQYVFCGILSLLIALVVEPVRMRAVIDAALPILYGGVCSVGIAYTLQIVAQKSAPPAHAA
ncbi:MAG: DMT family transporter, partial [Spirochaetales bacterium]|nr:DMT family transporter [Spirochaetales bacterium]